MDNLQETIERLRALTFDGMEGSHERLSAICNAIYSPDFGWTAGACEELCGQLVGWLEQYDPADWADEYLAEQGLMRLPVDADGEVIHVGDVMDCGEHFGIQEVEGFIHGAVAFTVCDPQPARICTCPARMTRHYRKPTVEDVLREFVNVWIEAEIEADSEGDIFATYADKLREVMADE